MFCTRRRKARAAACARGSCAAVGGVWPGAAPMPRSASSALARHAHMAWALLPVESQLTYSSALPADCVLDSAGISMHMPAGMRVGECPVLISTGRPQGWWRNGALTLHAHTRTQFHCIKLLQVLPCARCECIQRLSNSAQAASATATRR